MLFDLMRLFSCSKHSENSSRFHCMTDMNRTHSSPTEKEAHDTDLDKSASFHEKKTTMSDRLPIMFVRSSIILTSSHFIKRHKGNIMFTAAFSLLIVISILRSVTNDQGLFRLSSLGLQFLLSDSTTFLANISNAQTQVQCLTACLNSLLCLTVFSLLFMAVRRQHDVLTVIHIAGYIHLSRTCSLHRLS